MAEIRVKDNESLDSALRRFKRSCARSGVLAEVRKREHYEKPSVKRKKKSEAARKRKYNLYCNRNKGRWVYPRLPFPFAQIGERAGNGAFFSPLKLL